MCLLSLLLFMQKSMDPVAAAEAAAVAAAAAQGIAAVYGPADTVAMATRLSNLLRGANEGGGRLMNFTLDPIDMIRQERWEGQPSAVQV